MSGFKSQRLEDWVRSVWYKYRKFPTVREAAKRFSVSQATILEAVKDRRPGNHRLHSEDYSGIELMGDGPDAYMNYVRLGDSCFGH